MDRLGRLVLWSRSILRSRATGCAVDGVKWTVTVTSAVLIQPGEAPRVPLLANSIPYEQGISCYCRALRTRLGWVATEVDLR